MEDFVETAKLSFPGEARRVVGGTMIPASTTEQGETVWFSLSTISHEQPPQTDGACGSVLILHEDAWRQSEFFPECNVNHVHEMVGFLHDQELRSGGPAGFRDLYVRDEFPTPISSLALSLSELSESLKCASPRRGVALSPAYGTPQLVTGGFALDLPGGGVVYGRSVDDKIVSLSSVFIHGQHNPTQDAVEQLAAYARGHNLLVVAWLLLVVVRPASTSTIWEWPTLFPEPKQPKPANQAKRPWWKFW
jgi:hypothetical protein